MSKAKIPEILSFCDRGLALCLAPPAEGASGSRSGIEVMGATRLGNKFEHIRLG
jgi:hypothetical protein